MASERSVGRSGGFTLIEVLVVLALFAGILAMVGLSQPDLVTRYQLNNAARQVYTDLRLVRTKAITQNATFRVSFTAGGRRYRVEKLDVNTNGWQNYVLHARGDEVISNDPAPIELEESIRTSNGMTIIFRPRGTAVANPSGVPLFVTHAQLPAEPAEITISLTGHVSLD